MEALFKLFLLMGPVSLALLLVEVARGKLTRFQRWSETTIYQLTIGIGIGMPILWAIGFIGLITIRN